jgi:hypothetical protein
MEKSMYVEMMNGLTFFLESTFGKCKYPKRLRYLSGPFIKNI